MTQELAPTERHILLGPDRTYTFVGGDRVENILTNLMTPELQVAGYTIDPKRLTLQQYIAQSGLPPQVAEQMYTQSTNQLTTFEVYNTREPEPKGTILMIPGYDAQRGALQGNIQAGDQVGNWNNEGYNVATVNYPQEFNPRIFKEQLLGMVLELHRTDPDRRLILAGHSFGGFAIYQAMSLMNKEELKTLLSHISELRLCNAPSGLNDLAGDGKLMEKPFFRILQTRFRKPLKDRIKAFKSEKRQGDTTDVVVRNSSPDSQIHPANKHQAKVAMYNSEATDERVKQLVSTNSFFEEFEFSTTLQEAVRELSETGNTPRVVMTTSSQDKRVPYTRVIGNANNLALLGLSPEVFFFEQNNGDNTTIPEITEIHQGVKTKVIPINTPKLYAHDTPSLPGFMDI